MRGDKWASGSLTRRPKGPFAVSWPRKLECPEEYEEHSNACYYFGTYSSHNAAKQTCETVGARLADLNSINSKYVQEKVHFLGGNDHWIGSYIVRGKITKKKANACPMMRGQNGRTGGLFAQVNCNSAYPFICQKYGENRFSGGNRDVVGYEGFLPGIEGEFELPVTRPATEATTVAVEEAGSNNSLVAVVSCIIILIVSAILIRFYCNKRSKRKHKKEKKLLEQHQQQIDHKTPVVTDKSSSNTMNNIGKLSRSNASVIKPISIPETNISLDQTTVLRRPSVNDLYENTTRYDDDDEDYHEDDRYYKSKRLHDDETSYYQNESQRTPSFERYLHGRHDHDYRPPSAEEPRYLKHPRHARSRSRRRSMPAMESMTDLATTRYSDSSESEYLDDSHLSDSVISASTASSYRSYHRHRGHHRRHRTRSYGREESVADEVYYHDHEDRHRSRRHRGRRRHREHKRMEPQSRFEQYAVGRPPSAALDVLERKINSETFRQQQSYLKRSLPRSDGYNRRRSHLRVPETAKPTYFPQIFTTWSHEDLEIFDSLKKSNNASKPLYPRSTPKSHIRVNRHIHDFETPKQRHLEKGKAKSDETDHIYESLDEVSSNKRNQKSKRIQAIPLRTSKTNAIPDSSLSRDLHRSSGGSRASMRSRGLPATPVP